jgi:hypothetical protein
MDVDVLQLKSNVLPRGLVPLEDLFDFNDVAKKPKIEAHGQEVEDCNIGTEEKPRIVKLSKSLLLSPFLCFHKPYFCLFICPFFLHFIPHFP